MFRLRLKVPRPSNHGFLTSGYPARGGFFIEVYGKGDVMAEKKPMGPLRAIGLGCGIMAASVIILLILIVIFGLILRACNPDGYNQTTSSSSYTAEPVATTPSAYAIGDSFSVGYTRYQVNGIQWRTRVGDSYLGKEANARYLLVKIQIKNEDKENRMIPPATLIDENGAKYDEAAGDRMYLGKEAVFLDSLNPGVEKKATLLFDVPPDHRYHLVLTGGYWSNEQAKVQLN